MQRTFDADDAWLLAAGRHTRLYEVLGAHPHVLERPDSVEPSAAATGSTGSNAAPGAIGATFRVWAPNATEVSVIGDRNGWRAGSDPLEPDPSGVWRATLPGWTVGDHYKYSITGPDRGRRVAKADPVAFSAELPPATASIIAAPTYSWNDTDWMGARGERQRHDRPLSIYEVHLGSWRFEPGGYAPMGRQLADYCVDMGFTHVELLPIMAHPFYGSWGYQSTGYFAPTARYGEPEALMEMIDILHRAGVGVILDWVPSHFPTDEFALGYFDGTHLYEHADPRQGFHPDWKSFVFNYDRPEVCSFLLSSAHYWLDVFHVDGLRVDAVASMLYLDYSRGAGEWVPNIHGGNENLGAIAFLQELNRSVYGDHPDVLMIAEESTAWPGVTNPTDADGLGFGFKWDMGWMNDTLEYMGQEPVHRRWHHDRITFRSVYAAAEHYVLPLSHDEVVHGKSSLLGRMPGDRWQQFANLRVLFGYQWGSPGKKLVFMGGEFAVPDEWNHEVELAWPLLGDEMHAGVQGWVRRLNEMYAELPALSRVDRDPSGFRWVINDDRDQSVLAFLRFAPGSPSVLVVINNTPVPRDGYRVGVPDAGVWHLAANSDDPGYGGSGMTPGAAVVADAPASHGLPAAVDLTLPPLSVMFLVGPEAVAARR